MNGVSMAASGQGIVAVAWVVIAWPAGAIRARAAAAAAIERLSFLASPIACSENPFPVSQHGADRRPAPQDIRPPRLAAIALMPIPEADRCLHDATLGLG